MEWKATYSDESEYLSEITNWEDLPATGLIKIFLIFPSGNMVTINGWDFYALEAITKGIRATYWKDTFSNDINGDPLHEPLLNKGVTRSFFDDQTGTEISYKDASTVKSGITANLTKKGEWVTDTLAKKMGIL